MAESLTLGLVHHITLRMTQLDRSIAFYGLSLHVYRSCQDI